MNERQKIQHLFQFDLWCTQNLTNFLLEKSPFTEFNNSISFLSHIINAQEIWFYRIVQQPPPDIGIWTEYKPEDLPKVAREAHQKWLDLIGDHEVDLDSEIHYTNTKGVLFQNPIWQIAHHVIIHGQHHRAQISLLLRNCDIAPPPTDYIHYTRVAS